MKTFIQLGEKIKGKIKKNEEYSINEFMKIISGSLNIFNKKISILNRIDLILFPKKYMKKQINKYIEMIRLDIELLIKADK